MGVFTSATGGKERTAARMKAILILAMIAVAASVAGCKEFTGPAAPYPKSDVIAGIEWDFDSHQRSGEGSDLWYTTWCSDNKLYSAWGDGCGFGACDDSGPLRASLGVSRVEGTPPNWNGRNVWGGLDPLSDQDPVLGKPSGILCVDHSIYLFAKKQDTWDQLRVITSHDLGKTWNVGEFDFGFPLDALSPIQFGRDYLGGPSHVYFYFLLNGYQTNENEHLGLARVPKDKIEKRNAYEFFAGTSRNEALWSKDAADRKAIFTNPGGDMGFGIAAMYHADLDRYLLTTRHNENAGWGFYEAPDPWGPWRTVSYYQECWKDCYTKFSFVLTPKWITQDGRHFWMIFSGHPEYDSYNHLKGKFKFRDRHNSRGDSCRSQSSGAPRASKNRRLHSSVSNNDHRR